MSEQANQSAEAALEGGSYEVLRQRLLTQAKDLGARADQLNQRRVAAFGGTELTVIGNERIRTENNCIPRSIVELRGMLIMGYNVFLGLKTGTRLEDVFSLHKFEKSGEGYDLSAVPLGSIPGLFDNPTFQAEFAELYKYYKDARLLVVREPEPGKLLAVFQVGQALGDIKAFRWAVSPSGQVSYVDNRGDPDHRFPPSHDFEWVRTGRDDQVSGRHPHVNILNEIFVETVGGDLTVKVENNTQSGAGVYSEPVQDKRQALDDAEIWYAKVGGLILLKILPYRETTYRYLVYNSRTKDVTRLDPIGQSCVRLPEDHGLVFPGGYYLESGDTKVFDAEIGDLIFKRSLRSPNGEDVLYVYYHQEDGRYLLLPYNLIRKEVQNPITCHGFTLFDDGTMVVFRQAGNEPTRVHPMQIWRTPFMSELYAAEKPNDGSYLGKVGNADLVRGISEAYSLKRLIEAEKPTRRIYEDLIASTNRVLDAYYWLDQEETGRFATPLVEIKKNADLIIDEFEKVLAMQRRAAEALSEAQTSHAQLIADLRPRDWRRVADFLDGMTRLRKHRGHLITLRDVRYIDTAALDKLGEEAKAAFDEVSKGCVAFMLTAEALGPLVQQIEALFGKVEGAQKGTDLPALTTELDGLTEGLNLLSEVVSTLEVEDPTQRTSILEKISEVFGHLNRVRATLLARKKELLGKEGRAEFVAQFKLLGQAVQSGVALADQPEKCDESLSRLLVQLQELEARFSEFDEFLAELQTKREEIYEAFGAKKQQLLDERQRRAQNLAAAAQRIVEGVQRRAKSFKADDELNAYFASDAMILKLRQVIEQLRDLGDSVKADDFESKLKSARQDAVRNLRDQLDLYEDGANVIKFGKHKFSVNTEAFELTIVPKDGGMWLHLTGTELYEPIEDEGFNRYRDYWEQQLVSESPTVYRGEYLATQILADAEVGLRGLTVRKLEEVARDDAALLEIVRAAMADRYDEGYERGLHDTDTAAILGRLLSIRATAGLLRFSAEPRAWACLYWAFPRSTERQAQFHRRARSLGRLRKSFANPRAEAELAQELDQEVRSFLDGLGLQVPATETRFAGAYLVEELAVERPRFTISADAVRLRDALFRHLDGTHGRGDLEEDLRALDGRLADQVGLARAWFEAYLEQTDDQGIRALRPALLEAAVMMVTGSRLDRDENGAPTRAVATGLLGQHPKVVDRQLEIRLDELLTRLGDFRAVRVPGFLEYKKVRQGLVERERNRLRLEEFRPRVLTSFVRNKLINDVYLPLIGDNLAKQLGAAGEKKRTDLMGMLLLISPPGYGKTTLMEYLASRLGIVFMKVNGPALGHEVTSIDPADAPNATARQEVEKINLALEMGNNVMLYLDDIQHTNPELLQKFISLCDAQRRIEGVWKGRTKTYDLRGKKFCVVMAGNPYTESGEKFQIPDMLANRADTYNLGDILGGKEETFALSYLENALTSNSVLQPVATRSLDDVHRFIRRVKGEDVPQTEFAHSYSRAEIEEIENVLRRLFRVQQTLLRVNLEYIASASQDDRFRTEPPFKLQGSYRNMNKLAEKVVAAMNDEELDRLIGDHYAGESQTLTTGAEHNLLKFAELRGIMSDEQKARWEAIKRDFRRLKVAGGSDDDPVTRVTSTLGNLGEQLEGIQDQLKAAVLKQTDGNQEWLGPQLARLEQALSALGQKPADLAVTVKNEPPVGVQALLQKHAESLEQALLPLVRASAQSLEESRNLSRPLLELIELMKLNVLTEEKGRRTPKVR